MYAIRSYYEFDMSVITTVPNVPYYAYTKKHGKIEVHTPSELPEPTVLEKVEEPYIRVITSYSIHYTKLYELVSL